MDDAPLAQLTKAAARAAQALGLRRTPEVVRDERAAFSIASATRGGEVVLGEGAYWVVCLADADRLVGAGYETAPAPTAP